MIAGSSRATSWSRWGPANLARRLGQSVIPAYILAGVLLGPNSPVPVLRVVETSELFTLLQELGAVLLLRFIGLHFSPSSLLERRRSVLRAGTLNLGLNASVGFVAGILLGFTLLEAVVLSGVVYISSSAIITKSLIELGWIADPESESILGVLVFEDLVIAVFFFAIGLGTDPGTVGAVALPVLALAVVSTASELVSGYLGGRAYGLSERRSVRVAVAMVARGEFSLVLAALAVQARMDPTLAALAVGYVLVMSVLGTALMGQSARIEALARRLGLGDPLPAEGEGTAP
ncbi:hypothetical protein BRC93_12920 [Halobacteriales archaeon QS_5_70_15]|nr:MAG: hypothetical protein BRC93_12920 [Halobacteriales archaeon QS_5_70_15]